jgi:hypothetical protein
MRFKLPELSVLNIAALFLLAFIGFVMVGVIVLTYFRITESFEPLHPEGDLAFSAEAPFKFVPGDKVEMGRVYCNEDSDALTGSLSSTFVEVGTNKQLPGGGLTAVYAPGCNRHTIEITIPRDITPGHWFIVRSIVILSGNKFQQITSVSPLFEVVVRNP